MTSHTHSPAAAGADRAVTERGFEESHLCPPFHSAIELIGRRWNGVILRRLGQRPLRFSEIRRGIPGLTDAMLTTRLRELEHAGLVVRHVTTDRPVQVTYALTDIGDRLAPVLAAVAAWGHEWVEETGIDEHHA